MILVCSGITCVCCHHGDDKAAGADILIYCENNPVPRIILNASEQDADRVAALLEERTGSMPNIIHCYDQDLIIKDLSEIQNEHGEDIEK